MPPSAHRQPASPLLSPSTPAPHTAPIPTGAAAAAPIAEAGSHSRPHSPSPISPELPGFDPAADSVAASLMPSLTATADVYASLGLTTTARFFAHHAHTLAPSNATARRLASIHAAAGDHRQAVHCLITSTSAAAAAATSPTSAAVAPPLDLTARLLAASSLFALGNLDACLALLGDDITDTSDNPQDLSALSLNSNPVHQSPGLSPLSSPLPHDSFHPRARFAHPSQPSPTSSPMPCSSTPHLQAALCVLRARVYEHHDNPPRAVLWYKRALRADLFCIDAFDRIVNAALIPPDDARVFINDITGVHLSEARNPVTAWLAAYYRAAADRTAPLPPTPPVMLSSFDIRHLQARRAFDTLDFAKCAFVVRDMLMENPHVPPDVLITYLAALVELDDRQNLFLIAHQLVDNDPKAAVPWLAVAYYYFASGKADLARRFLRKATSIDARLAPAWVALGHAFALQDESDQAMAAYRTANRLFPGAQLPPLFMGMEYLRQGSLSHASVLFQTAMHSCKTDPAPRHELGVVAYRMGELLQASSFFKEALSLWDASDDDTGVVTVAGRSAEAEETTLVNLGHCYRRMAEFDRAKRCYERALALRPRAATTCTALGMTLHALGDCPSAVIMYHRALRDSPGDAVCNELLERALWDMYSGSEGLDCGKENDDEETDEAMPMETGRKAAEGRRR